ncbi:MAG TPA: hypothetical protein GXX75_22660 [Clostridiales bacterium]|nr:hypothetical protein [Clostridiales bacterium]
MKVSAGAAMKIDYMCKKFKLPNGKTVDILDSVFIEIGKWLQVGAALPESGGFILGYKHLNTGNITLENVTTPQEKDIRNRIRFFIKDAFHFKFLETAKRKNSYYMGVWHTHPQVIPSPSGMDYTDWNETLLHDRTACDYAFFIIAGTDEIRIWVGDLKTKKIKEIFECPKDGGLYKNT